MTLKKGKEQDEMMLAKVKEQDGIILVNVKVPSIPTSAACCDDVPLTNVESSSYTFYNRQLLHRTASSKHSYLQLINPRRMREGYCTWFVINPRHMREGYGT